MGLRRMPGSMVWVYQCKINGKTWSRSTGHADRRKAERMAPRLRELARLHRGSPDGLPALKQAATNEVARIEVDVWPSQGQRASCAFLNLIAFAGDIPIDRIDGPIVERYQRKRLQEAARATVDKELCLVLRMLRLNGMAIARPTPKRGRATEAAGVYARGAAAVLRQVPRAPAVDLPAHALHGSAPGGDRAVHERLVAHGAAENGSGS